MNYKINEFKKIDSLSDIKMIDYFNNNFKKYELFQGMSYPHLSKSPDVIKCGLIEYYLILLSKYNI